MKKKVQAGIDAVREGIPLVVFGDANVERPITAAMSGQGTQLLATATLAATT
jgi:acetylglutamate/LysW-gamma-L-alpha-aminoadipate kinase